MSKSQLILRVLLVATWIRVTFEYVAQMIIPDAMVAFPLVSLAYDTVIIMLGCWTVNRRRDFIMAAVFIIATFFSTIIVNGYGLEMYINGMRDFIGYIFVIPILRYFIADDDLRDDFVATVDRHLLIFLIVQVPCVATQFIRWGAGDEVGGSLGSMSSGFISTLIYLISFYLMQRRLDPDRLWHSIWENKHLILLLLPTLFNETKVSFVYLAMYILLLMPLGRKTFKRALIAIPVTVAVLYGSAVAFVAVTAGVMGEVDDLFSLDYYMEGYLMSADSEDSERFVKWLVEEDEADVSAGMVPDIPRFNKLMMLPDLLEDARQWTLGRGVGHFKGGTMIAGSDFYIENEWILIGSIPYIYHLLIQLGMMGVVMMTVFFVVNLGMKPREGLRRQYNLQLYVLGLILIIQLYQDTLRNAFMCLFIYYVMLMAWRPAENGTMEALPS